MSRSLVREYVEIIGDMAEMKKGSGADKSCLAKPAGVHPHRAQEAIELQALYLEYLAGLARIQELTAPLQPFCDRVGATLINDDTARGGYSGLHAQSSGLRFGSGGHRCLSKLF